MTIQLSEHFTYKKIFRFALPSIVMMVFTSIYGVVDGTFVSNFVGKTPFAAVNLVWPFLMILGAFGFMIGTGGSALVAKTLGENKIILPIIKAITPTIKNNKTDNIEFKFSLILAILIIFSFPINY